MKPWGGGDHSFQKYIRKLFVTLIILEWFLKDHMTAENYALPSQE